MYTPALVFAIAPAAVLAQSPLYGQCMLWLLSTAIITKKNYTNDLFKNRWRSRLDWFQDLCFWRSMPIQQVNTSLWQKLVSSQFIADNLSSDWFSQCLPGSGGNPPASSTTGGTTTAPTLENSNSGTGLHDKFKAKGKLYFGAEIDHYHLNNNPLITIVKSSFGQVTNENSMKWDAIERKLLFRSCSSPE
jgi:hypothetical protein